MYKNKWLKYSLIALSILILLGFLISIIVKKIALEKITNIPGITCKNLSFNPFTGCLEVEGLNIERPISKNESEVLGLITNQVHVHGLSYWQYLKNDKVYINEVVFADLSINITQNKRVNAIQRDSNAKGNTPKEILIDNFTIEQGKLSIQNQQFQKLKLDTFSTNIERLQFLVKKDSQQIVWNQLEFLGKYFLMNGQKSDNKLFAESIQLSKNNQLLVNQLKWKPKYTKANYLDHHEYRKARIDVVIPQVVLQQFPIEDLIFKQSFKAQSITFENSSFKIYSDKNKKACPDCIKKYHYENLIDADLKIDIDSILVKNGLIVLEELGQGKEKFGKLDWSKVHASVYDLTNNPKKIGTHPHTVADIQAVFVNEGNINLHFEFPNFNKNADYHFYGDLDKVKLKKINRFLIFSKRFRIKKGEVNKFAFSGSGNLQRASGDMELRYKDLSLQFLKKDHSPRKFLSKLANNILGNKNNPDKEDKLRKGKMYFERDERNSFISNWWKTMQTGIKSIMLPNILLPDELDNQTK